jgi:DNA-binding MarR family transcriptional regulator
MQEGRPDDAWTKFALSIFKVNGLIMRAGDGITRSIGQSSARWQVLGRAFEPQTVADMARDIGHARQGVQRIADVLAEEGLIVYKDHPTDRRTKLLELTPRGTEVLSAIYVRQLEWSQRVTAKIDSKHLVAVADALEAIGQIVEAEVD